jgi:photosystem II stability/assembly factor-like uncharacterized protein
MAERAREASRHAENCRMHRRIDLLVALAALAVTPACLGSATSNPVAVRPSAATASAADGVTGVPYVWKSVAINGGGFVTGLVFSNVDPGVLYARTDIGGAYRYDPTARSWVPLTDFVSRKDQSYMGIESIAADPVNADRVYMAVGMYAQSWAGPGAFMRSDDRGASWQVTPMGSLQMGGNDLGRSNGERLAVVPNAPKILLFGSRRHGMWKSSDEAETWSPLETFPVREDPNGLGIPFVLFERSSGKPGEPSKVIYAGVSRKEQNLYRSSDAGQTWQLVPKQPSGFLPSRAALDRDGTLYVSYGDDPGPFAVKDGALFRFDPKREIWTDVSPIRPSKNDAFGYGAVTVDPSHPGTVLATTIDRWSAGGEIFRSTDSGKTWKPLLAKAVLDSAGVAHPYHHRAKLDTPQWMGDIKIDPFAPDHALVVDGGGLWATEDLTQADRNEVTHWSYRTNNLEETAVRGIISPPEGAPLLSAMADLCGFRHDSLTESPKRGNFENPTCASSDAIDFAGSKPAVMARVGNHPWDGSQRPRGAVSKDGGITWTQFGSEPAGSNGEGSVAVSADGVAVLWAPRDVSPARSTDGGATWVSAQGLPPPAKVPGWAPINVRLAADRVNPSKFYVYDAFAGNGYTSEDGGATFALTSGALSALPEYNLPVASIQTVPGRDGDVWVTGGKELFHSTDSGHTYASVGNVEESYGVGFGHPAPGQDYPAVYLSGKLGGVTGFFRSDDGGATFARINDDAHQYGGSNLIIGDPRVFGRVFIAPGGRGILYGEPAGSAVPR